MAFLNDEQVDREIERLSKSPYVALARKSQQVRNQRHQLLAVLQKLEKQGKELERSGITMDLLESMERDLLEDYDWGC